LGLSHALAVLVLLTASVAAQPSPEATKLFEEGRELAKQQKWAEACETFQKSLALDAAPGTKLNLGDCLEKQGKVRSGWLMFEEAARDFDQLKDSRAKFAHDRAASASAKLATLVIKIAEPSRDGLAIRIDDRTATPQPEMVERVDPGRVEVTVTAPNTEQFTTTVTTAAGKTTVVDVPALAGERTPDEPRAEPVAEVDNGRRTRVTVAIGIGVVGGLSLVSSGILGLLAKSKYDAAFDSGQCFEAPIGNVCSPQGQAEVEKAGTMADIGTGFLVAGTILTATGVIVYLTAPKPRSVTVTPIASSSSAGVVVGGTF